MSFTPELTSLFLFMILAVVVLGSIFSFLAVYIARENRLTEHRRIASKENPVDKGQRSPVDTGFYYLRTGRLRVCMDMKVRLYSLEECDRELNCTVEACQSGGFVAALKAYRYHDDHWSEMPLERTISSLELGAGEYEVNEGRGALLLRKLPEGLPARAREKFDQPEDLRLFTPEAGPSRNVGSARGERI